MLSACEGLDDEHRRTAVAAYEGGLGGAVIGAAIAGLSGRGWRRLMQKIASGGDIVLAVGVGEQAVVADPVRLCLASSYLPVSVVREQAQHLWIELAGN